MVLRCTKISKCRQKRCKNNFALSDNSRVNDNGEHFEYISNLAKSLDNLIEINVQAYHATGIPKARDIGKNDIFEVLNF